VHHRILAALLISFCAIAPAAVANELDDSLTRAREAVEANRLNDALKWFQKAAAIAPSDATLHIKVGVVAVAIDQYSVALKAFEKALEVDPRNTDALFNSGKLLAALGRNKDALPHLEKALKLSGNDMATHMELISVLIALKRFSTARKALKSVLQQEPGAHPLLAALELRAGRWEKAHQAATTALKQAPKTVSAGLLFATTLIHAGHLEQAVSQLKQLIRQAPGTLANVPYSLALAAFLQGRFADARSWMMEAKSRAPSAFDISSAAFNALAFPTDAELAFLNWIATAKGPDRAPEASISKLVVNGSDCHAAPVMATLAGLLRPMQKCIGGQQQPMVVMGQYRRHLRGISVTPKGSAAHCLQLVLKQRKSALSSAARCTVSFAVTTGR
jgi:tetratricopeptide (TPR) repeat protein